MALALLVWLPLGLLGLERSRTLSIPFSKAALAAVILSNWNAALLTGLIWLLALSGSLALVITAPFWRAAPTWLGALLWLCSPGALSPQHAQRRRGIALVGTAALSLWGNSLGRFTSNWVGHAPAAKRS